MRNKGGNQARLSNGLLVFQEEGKKVRETLCHAYKVSDGLHLVEKQGENGHYSIHTHTTEKKGIRGYPKENYVEFLLPSTRQVEEPEKESLPSPRTRTVMELRISGLTKGLAVPLMMLFYDSWG